VERGTGRSSIGLLGHHRHRLDLPPVDHQVDQQRRRRRVVVPDAVVDELEVPDDLAGPGVETDDALRIQVVPEPVAAVIVVGRRAGRDVDIAQLRIGAEQPPSIGGAGVAPRLVLPGLVPRLARLGNRMKLPQLAAGAHIEAADVTGRRELIAGTVGDDRPDHDDVADHQRRRHQLVVASLDRAAQPLRGVDGAVGAEAGDRPAGPGVDGPEIGIPSRQEDACLPAVRPVGNTPRVIPGVGRALVLPAPRVEDPERLTGHRIDRHRLTHRRFGVEHAVDQDRRRLERGGHGGQRRPVRGHDRVVW